MIDPSVLASLPPELAIKVFEADQAREARERELWSALTAARADVDAVVKNGWNAEGRGFPFATSEDLIAAATKALDGHGLTLVGESFTIAQLGDGGKTRSGDVIELWVARSTYSLVHRNGARYVFPIASELPFRSSVGRAEDKSALAAQTEILKYRHRDLLSIRWSTPGDKEVSDRNDDVERPRNVPAKKQDFGPKAPPAIVPRTAHESPPGDDPEPKTAGEIRAYLSAPGRSPDDTWTRSLVKRILTSDRSKSDPAWLALIAPFRLDAIQSGPPEIPDWLWHWLTITPLTSPENAGILNRPEWAEQLCRQGVKHRLLDNWCDALIVGAERKEEMKARLLAAKREGMGNAITR